MFLKRINSLINGANIFWPEDLGVTVSLLQINGLGLFVPLNFFLA